MKQTLEEAANDYLQKILEASDFEINFEEDNYDAGARDAVLDVTERAFKAGAEWQSKQSPWISVEERLPEVNKEVIVIFNYHGTIIINTTVYLGEDDWRFGCSKILGWMPIPTFDQILEANKDVLQRMKEKGTL
jgi:hypothetical protein